MPLLSGFFVLHPGLAHAQQACQYGSTQGRVQRDGSDPWKSDLTVQRGQSFNVAGFHNGTGQFGSDVTIQVVGPNFNGFYSNGQQVWPSSAGSYTVYVNTRNQWGGGCSDQARVNVQEVKTCKYGSTQARVQPNINQPWAPWTSTTRAQGFNSGSFHDNTGRFAMDTTIRVFGNGLNGVYVANGARVIPPSTGWYRVEVRTPNQSGTACQEDAWVNVTN